VSAFRFKQFTVEQDKCAMKVGTDALLLGAWADCSHATRVLDIGTGTGVLALMLAQRAPQAHIDAIEIDAAAAEQATQNVARSPWQSRVTVYEVSLQQFAAANPLPIYDFIVSNPPFFHQSLKTPDPQRAQARHTDSLLHDVLLHNTAQLLLPNGSCCFVLPTNQSARFCGKSQCQWFVSTQKNGYLYPPKQTAKARFVRTTETDSRTNYLQRASYCYCRYALYQPI
jgi:tRNA1Val (adenine37-N6)-methyltransferase